MNWFLEVNYNFKMSSKKSYEVYKKVKTLGEGSFGKAYLVECKSDKSYAVIKQIDITNMPEEEKKETLDEAKIMEAFNHPNICRFREVYKTKRGKLCIVMDYADGGDLQQYLKKQKKYMTEDMILSWFTQICLALKHIHDRKVLHRDLKSQNVFLTKSNWVKLGDFGIAKVLEHTKDIAKTVVGTPYYLSPEIIESSPYSFSSDIWSLGVLLYEMAALRPPFDAGSLHDLASKIIKGKYPPIPKAYSTNLNLLIGTLLQVDPKKRPNINQILKYPLIAAKIPQFLEDDLFQDEFSHTIIHNRKFFDAKGNAIKAPLPEIKEEAKEDPKQHHYKNYVNYIKKVIDTDDNNYYDPKQYDDAAAYKARAERDDDEEESKTAGSGRSSVASTPSVASSSDTYDFQEVDWDKFSAFMNGKFGAAAFKKGYGIMQKNKGSRFAVGDSELAGMLRGIVSTEKEASEFVSLCSTYMILENYAKNIAYR